MERPLRSDLLVALFVAITWAACVFAAAGLLAVLLDRDPVEQPTAPGSGVLGFAVAGVVVWLAVAFGMRGASGWAFAIAATAGVYLVVLGAASLLGTFALVVEQATSPFLIVAALLAAPTVLVARAIRRRPPNAGLSGGGGRS